MNLRALVAVATLIVCATSAHAVTDEEIFRDFRFNFINPGGRSLGMGGAFISIADDATAAQANPAGLTNLVHPQFFFELRNARFDSTVTSVEFTDPSLPDEGYDLVVRTEPKSDVNPGFISYVHPLEKVYLGASRQEVLNAVSTTSNLYDVFSAEGDDLRSGAGQIDLELVNYNLSVGWMVTSGFRLGATLSYGRMEMESRIVNTYTDPTGDLIGAPGLAGAPIEMYRTEADGSDADWTITAGLLWNISHNVSLGAVYRQGGSFDIDAALTARPIDRTIPPGQIADRVFLNESGTLLTAENDTVQLPYTFEIPDVIGFGVSGSPIPELTLSFDAQYIAYSDLLDGFNSRLNVLTFGFQSDEEAAFTVDDQTNLHFGAEYVLRRKTIWAFRAGWHQDKDNRIRSDFAPGGFGLESNDNFPGRDNVDHYSLGLGIVLGNRFQVDLAGDFSDIGTELVASLIFQFGQGR